MNIFRSGIVIALFTFISRIFGLARELFVASLFGATTVADSVNVAFKLPHLFRRIFAEGAFSAVFVPIFNEKMLKSKDDALAFTGTIFTMLIVTLAVLVLLMQLFMPYLLYLIAPGFQGDKEKFDLTILLCRITIPYLIFMSVTALFGGILNSVKKFAAFAFSPIILSLVIIFGTMILQTRLKPDLSIAVSLLIAGILQILFMFYCVAKSRLLFPIICNINDKDSKKFLLKVGPAVISSGVQQLNIFISQSIASFIPGAISILAYADRIYQFPLSIIGVTFGTILLPELSRIYKQNDYALASKTQNQAIKLGLLLSLPASFGIIGLSDSIIHVIYEHGAFTRADTIKTANAISVFAIGLPAFILSKILTPIFYANQDTKTPMRITIYSLIANTILNVLLMIVLGHVGIALGSSISAWFNVYLLYKNIDNNYKIIIDRDLKIFCFKTLLSCFFMYTIITLINHNNFYYFYHNSLIVKTIALASTIIVGAASFFAMAFCLKLKNYLLK